MNWQNIKNTVAEEARQLILLALYLTLFLNSLTVYKSLILEQNLFSFFHLGYNFFEALLLAKIILLGNMLKLGNRYSEKDLIIPTFYKALVFSLFVFFFTAFEHLILGLIKGQPIDLVWREWTEHRLIEGVGKLLIAFICFIMLFSFMELSRVIGQDRVYKLFFRRNQNN